MNFRKFLAGFVSIAFLSVSMVTPALAEEALSEPTKEIMPISQKEIKPDYLSFTGVIKEMRPYHADENAQFVSIVDENGNPANLIVDSNTYLVNDAELTEGAQIIFFYEANRPMIMIYPPQYNPDVVAIIDDQVMIKVGMFDENLVSLDNQLKLKNLDETEILLPDGSPYTGKLENHKLVVLYGVSTKSIPAQTNPDKVIVLDASSNDEDLYDENYIPDLSKMNIVVENDMVITEPKAYTHADGAAMIPLRVVAEALGYEVGWDGENYSITLNDKISLRIDKPNYTNADTSITLDTAPTLFNDTTYVPLNFFTNVLSLNNAYVFEGQIDINDGEKME